MEIYRRRFTKQKAQLINLEFKKLIDVIERIAKISSKLYDSKEIIGTDLEKILLVLKNISDYLYDKYGEYGAFEKEVITMLTTLYNPVLVKKEVEEGIAKEMKKRLPKELEKRLPKELEKKLFEVAEKALKNGLSIEVVAEISTLDIETVRKINNKLNNDKDND